MILYIDHNEDVSSSSLGTWEIREKIRVYECELLAMEANIGGPAGISNDENELDADHASL